MKQLKIQLILGAGLLAVAGLWLSLSLVRSPSPPASPAGWSSANAQAKLPTTKLWLGSQELVAEIARKPQQVATGMMFRTNIPEEEAMLFNLGDPRRANFWMKNCPESISAAYITSDGVIQEIEAELLRAIADTLDCPMPPFIPAQAEGASG